MLESIVFHSQLSSIMEKLVISAVTEINKLMTDYCGVLRLELSREKHENDILRDKLRVSQINAHQGSALVNDPKHLNAPLKEARNATKIGKWCVRKVRDFVNLLKRKNTSRTHFLNHRNERSKATIRFETWELQLEQWSSDANWSNRGAG